MSNTVQNQTISKEANKASEVRPERSKRAPSSVARSIHSADATQRVSYKLERDSNDFRAVSSSIGEVVIINSADTSEANDGQRDVDQAASIATQASYRRNIENGGLSRQRSEAPQYDAERLAADGDKPELQDGVKLLRYRGSFRA